MKYLIGILIFIFLLIFLIIKLLTGGSSEKATPISLTDYANTDTTVQYVIDNPTQNDTEHRDITITVGRDVNTLTITGGYNGNVISSYNYTSNENSYRAFLAGLQTTAHFTEGNTDPKVANETGYCANGDRFSYNIVKADGTRLQHLWSTSCGVKTYKGLIDETAKLFRNQIPDFYDVTRNVDY